MKIEIGNFWTTVYSDTEQDMAQLFLVYDIARARKLPCAAINVHLCTLTREGDVIKKPGFAIKPYVTFPRFDEDDVRALLGQADIPLASVSIEVTPFTVTEDSAHLDVLPELHQM